jgi:hypothetical protein
MYFAFDPPSPTARAAMARQIQFLFSSDSGRQNYVYAMIDGAFDEIFFANDFSRCHRHRFLYENTKLANFAGASLYLAELPNTSEDLNLSLQNLIDACAGKPMWSIVVSLLSLDDLHNHFQSFLIGEYNDRLQWPIRWGDARVLPFLLKRIDSENVQILLKPLIAWLSCQRNGDLLIWEGGRQPCNEAPKFDMLPLSDSVFAQLVDDSEADAIISHIYDTQPDILSKFPASKCFEIVAQLLRCASIAGILSVPDRAHFSSLGLILRDGFSNMPEFQGLLSRVSLGGDYASEVDELSAEFWVSAERMAE